MHQKLMAPTKVETIKFLPHDPSQSGLSEKSFDIYYDAETGLYSTEEVNKSRLSTLKSPFKDSNKLHLPKNFKILPKELSLKELSLSLSNSQLGKFELGTKLDIVKTHVNQHEATDRAIRGSVTRPTPSKTLDLSKYTFFYNEHDATKPMISDGKMTTSLDPTNPKEAIDRLNAKNLFSLSDQKTKLKSKPVTTTGELLEPVKSFFPADLQSVTNITGDTDPPIYPNRNTLEFFDIEIPKIDKTTRANKDAKEKPQSWTRDSDHLIEEIAKKINNLRSNYERLLKTKVTEITAPRLASRGNKEEIDKQITAAFLKINSPGKAQKKPGPVSDGIEKVNLRRLTKEIKKIIKTQIAEPRIVRDLNSNDYFAEVAEKIIQKSKDLVSKELKNDKIDLEKAINKRVKDIKQSNANTANANVRKYQAMADDLPSKLLLAEFSTTNDEWIKKGITKKFRSQEDVKKKIQSSISTITEDSPIESISAFISSTIGTSDSIDDYFEKIFEKLKSWISEATGKEELLNEIFYNQLAKLLPEFNLSALPNYITEDEGSGQYYIDYVKLDELAQTDGPSKEIISKARLESIKEAAIQIRKIIESSKEISKRHKELSEEFQGSTSKPSQLTQLGTISYINPLRIKKTLYGNQYLDIERMKRVAKKIKTFNGSAVNTDSINIEISKIEKSFALKLEKNIALRIKSSTLLNSLPDHLKINSIKQVTKKLLKNHTKARDVIEQELESLHLKGYIVPQGSDINILVNGIKKSIKESLEKIQPECQNLKKRILKEQVAILDHNLEVAKYNKDLHDKEHREDFLERTTALTLNTLFNKVEFITDGTFTTTDVITQEVIKREIDGSSKKIKEILGFTDESQINQMKLTIESNLAKFTKCYHQRDFLEKAKKELRRIKVSDINQATGPFHEYLTNRTNLSIPSISDKDYYVRWSEDYKNQIEYYTQQKDAFIAESPGIIVPPTGTRHTTVTSPPSPSIPRTGVVPTTTTPAVGGRPRSAPSYPRAPISVEVRTKTVEAINSFLDPNPAAVKSTEQKQVNTVIQKNLKRQEDKPVPDEAYLGLGFIAEFKEDGRLIVQSVMKGKNPKRFKEHKKDGEAITTTELDENYLENEHIAKIWDSSKREWFEPTNDEVSMKRIAKIFHENKDTQFTLGNGRTITCAAKDKEVFVTNLCESAKITSTSELSGARYDPDTHGIEAVDKDDEIPKISQKMISAATSRRR